LNEWIQEQAIFAMLDIPDIDEGEFLEAAIYGVRADGYAQEMLHTRRRFEWLEE
jgi:hypothetical protein